MHVLMVAPVFPRQPDDTAGATLWRLCEGLIERGHTVKVVAPAGPGDTGTAALGRVEVRRVAAGPPLAVAKAIRGMARAVSEECAAGGVHIVHAHGWTPAGIAAAFARRHGRPLALTLHGADVRFAHRTPGGALLMGVVARRAAVVSAVTSNLLDDAARATRRTRQSIPVTPMPTLGGEPAAPPVGIPHGVVYAGRLIARKGVRFLLEALALLRKQGLPLDLTVVGDGPERAALKAQALALGVPAVFTGFVPPDQVPDYLAGKRVFVLPSIEEGRGLVLVEALRQGVPVVATLSGGVPDLLTEEGAGLLVPPGDAAALAGAIRRVASNDDYLTGAVNAGRALLARLSPGAAAAAFEHLYAEARGRRTGGQRVSRSHL
jgi:glycosyltransferase involved in cell wall biosynthesis